MPEAGAVFRPTLEQVAALAGVSVPTASKVLNARNGVAPSTRSRVQTAAETLGYVRRTHTRSNAWRSDAWRSVDLVMEAFDGSWPASVASGVEAAAYDANLHVVISIGRSAETDRQDKRDWVDRIINRGSSGVLLGIDLPDSERLRLERARIPVVLIHPLSDPPPGIASVGANTWAGAYEATEYLIELGHHDIALVTGPHGQLSEQARIAGYRSAMARAGIGVPPQFVRSGSYTRASGMRLVHQLIELPRPPTAIFICSDHMAIGGYEALADAGLRVPADVSVVGFDDLPEARWISPALTTIRQPLKEMARTALQLLASSIAGEDVGSRRVEFATTLVLRQSTQRLQPPVDRRGAPSQETTQ